MIYISLLLLFDMSMLCLVCCLLFWGVIFVLTVVMFVILYEYSVSCLLFVVLGCYLRALFGYHVLCF